MISDSLLELYGARVLSLEKGEILFEQGEAATHFFVVRRGRVKMAHYNDQGREFVQGYFTEGQSFGEPPFFNHMPYPASAIAMVGSEIWKCSYDDFIRLLRENFDVHLHLTQALSGRLIYKAIMLNEIAVEEAEHRLSTILDYFARMEEGEPQVYRVPFTRQQLADMTGLRVETVIRTIKALEAKKRLRIDDGKILWTTSTDTNQLEYF